MTDADFELSATGWVADQTKTILATGDTGSVHIMGRPVVLLTMIGRRSGRTRKVPVMRVEHDGRYLAVGSRGGAPTNPEWVANLRAHPDIDLQDGTTTYAARARELSGQERPEWWERAVEAFPQYDIYQQKTGRLIPIFLLEPR